MLMADVSLPPIEYQSLVCGPGCESYFESEGLWLVQQLKHYGMIGAADIDFLDVGCGCGRLPRFLLDEPLKSYEGFDRHPGMIAWCNEMLAPRDERFRFRHVDVRSIYVQWDAHAGAIDADTFVFPYPDGAFDSILVASVFTHMPLNEVRHYLRELRRVLRPAGRILLSAFFSDGAAYLKDDINFFHEPEAFLGAVSSACLTAHPVEPVLLFGYHHNWYVITHAT